jgi:hypothetical protein
MQQTTKHNVSSWSLEGQCNTEMVYVQLINRITSESVELNNQFGHFFDPNICGHSLLSLLSRQVDSGHAKVASKQPNWHFFSYRLCEL